MNSSEMNLNVDDYSQEDLLTLINIQNKDPITYDDIVDSTQTYINNYTTDDEYDLANFFQQVQNKLLEDIDYGEPENIQNNADSQLGNLWQNENVSQQDTDPNQANKVTERKQKIQIFEQDDHYVMNQNQLGVSNNYQVPVAQGQLNPNLKNTTTRIINIDSQYRENIIPFTSDPDGPTSPTNYTLDLSDPIHNAISINLTSYQIPYTWYLIDSEWKSNNCFFICPSPHSTITDCSMIDISSGNYSPEQLTDTIQTQLDLKAPNLDISYNPIDGKTIITNSGGDPYKIIFYDPSGELLCPSNCKTTEKFNNNLGWILGFRGNTSLPEDNPLYGQMIYEIPASPGSITSEALLDTFGSKYFMIVLDDYQQNHLNKGLVGITPTQKYIEIPSYWNSNLAISSAGCTTSEQSKKKIPTYVQNAPRRLTQAQLYTLNSTTQARSQTSRNRLTAPTNTNVLAIIPLRYVNTLKTGQMLIDDFNLDEAERVYFGPVDLERFRVRLVNDQGYTVNLNGNNWSFTLSATSLYQY